MTGGWGVLLCEKIMIGLLACTPSSDATVAEHPPSSPSSLQRASASHAQASEAIPVCSRPDPDAAGIVIMAKTEKVDPVWDDLDR
jgi:hypothetical protein